MSLFATPEAAPPVRYVSGFHRLVIGGALIGTGVVLWAALIGLWPAVNAATADTPSGEWHVPLVFGLWNPRVSGDEALFLLVVVASLLGSLIHVANSFAAHVARRTMTVSYLWWYPMRFVVGTGLALLLYVALRGGLFSGDFTSKRVNPFGVAAAAGLAGLFSKQATAKLAQLFDVAFNVQPVKEAPRIESLDPAEVNAGSPTTTVKVSGGGFVSGATATANETPVDATYVSGSELTVVLPAALLTAPATLKIRVDNPDPTIGASAPADLVVIDDNENAQGNITEDVTAPREPGER